MTPTELAAVRHELGWSTADMAAKLNVTQRTYQMYEAGKTSSGRRRDRIPTIIEIAVRGIAAARKIKTATRNQDIVETAKEFAAVIDDPFL